MDFEKYTERARGFLQSAQGLAVRSGHQKFTPDHICKVLLDDEQGMAARLIQAAGGDPRVAMQQTELALSKLPKVDGSGAGQIYLDQATAKLFEQAEEAAKKAGDKFVTAEMLLIALAVSNNGLKKADVNPQALNQAINDMRKGRTADSASAEDGTTH